MKNKEGIRKCYDDLAAKRLIWKKRNKYYFKKLEKYFGFIIPSNRNVLEIGCGTGELLHAVKPKYGVGIDASPKMIDIARQQFSELEFLVADAEDFKIDKEFDYIIISDLIGVIWDVQGMFKNIKKVANKRTRIVISYFNYLWEPILKLGESLHLKMKEPLQNWLSPKDIENLLKLEGFELIKTERKLLIPKNIPLVSWIFNTFFANMPLINKLCLTNIITARQISEDEDDYSVSIIVPAKNEKGNIENAIRRTPAFGKHQEFIFIEGNSSDGTYEEMVRIKNRYKKHDITVMRQSGKGKGNAVREAFAKAKGDILMILDADLTVPPEDLFKFYEALCENRGEFINGSRLVYQMEKQAMRLLNLIGNKFFSMFFTYILGQRLKDTLCGTKVLFKKDYLEINRNRDYFGDFDPFGDFDLIFGAVKLNLKIIEIPIRYKERQYGSTQISRFSHGWLLIKMSLFAAKKIKFI